MFFAWLERQPPGYNDDKIDRVMDRPTNDANDYYRALSAWEYRWCESHETYPTEPSGDSVAIARELLAKWRPVMDGLAPRFDWKKVDFLAGPK